MQKSLPPTEPDVEESGGICEDLQASTDYAIRLVCDALIMARKLQHAIDFRWRLISETKQMTNGMRERARPEAEKFRRPQE